MSRLCSLYALIWLAGILGAFKLDLESLHPNLEPIHGLDSGLGTRRIIKAHKTCKSKTNSIVSQIVSKLCIQPTRLGNNRSGKKTMQNRRFLLGYLWILVVNFALLAGKLRFRQGRNFDPKWARIFSRLWRIWR